MNNKQAIKMIRCLIANYGSYLDDKTAGYNNHDLCKALMKAKKSLDMWDKVMGEIENLTYYWCEVNPKSVIDDVLQIIEKYKKEIELL